MGDRTYSKTKLGGSIPHNKHISTKILSILLAILMVTTVFSSITFASDSNDDSTEENNIIASILEDAKEKISSAGSKLGNRLRDLIDRIRENRKGLLSLSLVTRYQKEGSLEIIENSVRMRFILPTGIDVDEDGKKDIRVWIFRRPALDLRPPAICWKTTLLIRRLPGMDNIKDDFLEVCLEYKPRLFSILKADADRIRIGYQSPMGEEIPKTCIVTHKNIPHFLYPRKKTSHRIGINPISIIGKEQLNLIFSVVDKVDGEVSSELMVQVNHSPAVKSEISFDRSKDRFIRRGQTLEFSRKTFGGPSNITLTVRDRAKEESSAGSLTISNVPKKISVSWFIGRKGYLEIDSHGSCPGKVRAQVDGVITLGFTPDTGLNTYFGWECPGILGLLKGKGLYIETETHASAVLSDFYVKVPSFTLLGILENTPYKLDLTASLLSLNLDSGTSVGNVRIKPYPGVDYVRTEVENAELVLEDCVIDMEPIELPDEPEKPSVTITSPEDDDSWVEGTVTITGTAKAPEDKKIQFVEVAIDDGDWHKADGNVSWSYNWDTKTVSDGKHKISAICFDEEYYSRTVSVNVVVDNRGGYPTVTITSPFELELVSGVVTIAGIADDDNDPKSNLSVSLQIKDFLEKNVLGKKVEVPVDETTGRWSYEWNTASLTPGIYKIVAKSYDGKDYSLTPVEVQVWVRLKCTLEVNILSASIDVTNFAVHSELASLDVSSFSASGSGALKLSDGGVSIEVEGSLDIENTTISVTNDSETIKVLENLSVDFDGYGMVLLSNPKIELDLAASLYMHIDGILELASLTFEINGTASASIEFGEGIFNLGSDFILLDVTELLFNVTGVGDYEDYSLRLGADHIKMNGSGSISISVDDKQITAKGSLDEFEVDNFYVYTDVGVVFLSGSVDFNGTASLTLTALDPFSFNLSFSGPEGITIEYPEIGIRSPDFGEVSARAESIKILGINGYAAFSYKRDEFNVSCHVKIGCICAVGLLVRFNESSYLIGDICGPFEFTFTLSADIKIEMGEDWIKITIGGRYRYIKAYSTFSFKGETTGVLDVDIELGKDKDTIVINISGIPDDIAVEIDGNTSVTLIKKLYFYLPKMVLINISDVNVSFDLHTVVGKGHLLVELNDAQRILELGHIEVNISDFFDMTIKGNVDVSSSMGGSGVLNVTWDESGNLTELYLNANESLEVDVNNLYFSFDDSRNSRHVLLAADQIYMNVSRTTTLVVTEDYIRFKGSSQQSPSEDEDFILKNFKLNVSGIPSEADFVVLEVASLEISGDLDIDYDNGNLTVDFLADVKGSDISISAHVEAGDLYLVADIGSVLVEGGGVLTIVDKNVSFISDDDGMDIVLEDVFVDFVSLVEDEEIILIIEDLNISFTGMSNITVNSLEDEIVIFADVGDSNITINTLWVLIDPADLQITFHSVIFTGPTTIRASLSGDMMVTIHTNGTLYARELSALGFNFYGIKVEPGGLSVGFDSAGNMLLGVHGSINVDQIIAFSDKKARTYMLLNDIGINGSLSRIVLGIDPDFKWIRIEGTAPESTTLSLEIPPFPSIGVSVEPGDFKISLHGLDTPAKSGWSLYTDSRLKLYLSDHLGLNGSIELIGHADIVLDVNSFNLNLSAPDLDFNLSGKLNGEIKIHLLERIDLILRGQCRGYEAGKGYIYIKVNEDWSGAARVNWNGTTYIIIPKLVRFSMNHTVDVYIEWDNENWLPNVTKWEGFGDFKIWIWNPIFEWWCPSWVEGPDYEDAVSLLAHKPKDVPLNVGMLKIIPGDKVNFTALYIPAGYFQELGSGQQQQNQQNQGHNPLGQEQLTFVFDFGDGYSNTTTVNKPEVPIEVHPPENHKYEVPAGTYTAKVTVYDSYGEEVTIDTIRIDIVEEYLEVEGKFQWDYETINESLDEEGKLHAYYVVENIANETLSTYELNWNITTDPEDIDWGSDWKFEPDNGTLDPDKNETVHVSFKPPEWKYRGDYRAEIKFIDVNNPDVDAKPKIKLRYGLMETFGGGILYMKNGDLEETFEDVIWVYCLRWNNKTLRKEGFRWQVNYTKSYANSDKEFNFTATPDSGVLYPGDHLPAISLTFPPTEEGFWRGNVTIERVGDNRDNSNVGFSLIVGQSHRLMNINLFDYDEPLTKGEYFRVHVEDAKTGQPIKADYIKVSYYKLTDSGWDFVCDRSVNKNTGNTGPIQAELDGNDPQLSKIKVITDNASYKTEEYEFYVYPGNPDNELPVAKLDDDEYTATLGDVISFDGSASYDPDGTIEYYHWDFGDGATSGGENENITYHIYTTTEGSPYTLNLTVTDNEGASNYTTALVHINKPPRVYIYVHGPWGNYIGPYTILDPPTPNRHNLELNGQVGKSYTFKAYHPSIHPLWPDTHDPDGTIVAYQWKKGSGTWPWIYSSDIPPKTWSWSTPGDYNVTLSVKDDDGAIRYAKITMHIS